MKVLRFRRNLPRYAAARLAGSLTPGRGATVGPLELGQGVAHAGGHPPRAQ